jgi:dienelactone hydrolase
MCIHTPSAHCQPETNPVKYQEVLYASGNLRIQAYLYKPNGDGPFPVVIYNHGSRDGRERTSSPFPHIGRILTRAGYAVLVPERRGYGNSDGEIWWKEVGGDRLRLIPRLLAETDDVLAGIDYLRGVPFIDTKRLAVMGWSFGGVISMLASARSTAFLAAVDQAGGALTWDRSIQMQSALILAAEKSTTPTLFMVAQNDLTTASVTTLADILKRRDVPYELVIYEPYRSPDAGGATSGHALFSAQGMRQWEDDVIEFLDRYLK